MNPSHFQKFVQLAKGDDKAMQAVLREKEAFRTALGVLAVVALIYAVGLYLFPRSVSDFLVYRLSLGDALKAFIHAFVYFVGSYYIVGYAAETLFDSKLNTRSFVQVMGQLSVVGVFLIIPQLAPFVALHLLYLQYQVLLSLGEMPLKYVVVMLFLSVFVQIGFQTLFYYTPF